MATLHSLAVRKWCSAYSKAADRLVTRECDRPGAAVSPGLIVVFLKTMAEESPRATIRLPGAVFR